MVKHMGSGNSKGGKDDEFCIQNSKFHQISILNIVEFIKSEDIIDRKGPETDSKS